MSAASNKLTAVNMKVDGDRFYCPHCGAFSYHAREPLRVWVRPSSSAARTYDAFVDEAEAFRVHGTEFIRKASHPARGETAPGWFRQQWTATLCASCERSAVWRDRELVFPRTATDVPAPHAEMPEGAKELYLEAAAVLSLSRRSAAALIRASMESLLKGLDESSERKTLHTRLGELHQRVPAPLWKLLTALRIVGNDALHDDDDELIRMYLVEEDAGVVRALFGAVNEVVQELIVRPRETEALYAMIPETKRQAAERSVDAAEKRRDEK